MRPNMRLNYLMDVTGQRPHAGSLFLMLRHLIGRRDLLVVAAFCIRPSSSRAKSEILMSGTLVGVGVDAADVKPY